jgi:hypothetical protein
MTIAEALAGGQRFLTVNVNLDPRVLEDGFSLAAGQGAINSSELRVLAVEGETARLLFEANLDSDRVADGPVRLAVPADRLREAFPQFTNADASPGSSVLMPDLIGVDGIRAQQELRALGLELEVLEQPTRAVPKGRVFAHTPAAGTRVDAGSLVVLNVSAGPPEADSSRIMAITIAGGAYSVAFETFGFEPSGSGQHVHFFFDTVPPSEAGPPGAGPWVIHRGPPPFTGYAVNARPAAATRMCVIVANADHTVQAGSGSCFALPN